MINRTWVITYTHLGKSLTKTVYGSNIIYAIAKSDIPRMQINSCVQTDVDKLSAAVVSHGPINVYSPTLSTKQAGSQKYAAWGENEPLTT